MSCSPVKLSGNSRVIEHCDDCFFFQSAFITKDKAAEFRHQVYLPITLAKVVEYLLIASGSLCILVHVALGLLLFTCRKKEGRIELCLINEVDIVYLVNLGQTAYL